MKNIKPQTCEEDFFFSLHDSSEKVWAHVFAMRSQAIMKGKKGERKVRMINDQSLKKASSSLKVVRPMFLLANVSQGRIFISGGHHS